MTLSEDNGNHFLHKTPEAQTIGEMNDWQIWGRLKLRPPLPFFKKWDVLQIGRCLLLVWLTKSNKPEGETNKQKNGQ